MDWLTEQSFLPILCALFFGLLVGSFLNVVIYRVPIILERRLRKEARSVLELPEEKEVFNLAYPPSHCPKCGKPIKPWSNIPLISYILQKGKCTQCREPISLRYPLTELVTGVALALSVAHFGWGWQAVAAMIFSVFVIAMAFIDAQTHYLPDSLTLPLLWLGILFNLNDLFVPLPQAVLGAVVGYMSLWLIMHAYKLLTGKVGMGHGDFKLLGALGAWLGISVLPIIVLLSSLVGIVAGISMRVGKQSMPFGPYLALSGWLVLMFQSPVMQFIDWWMTKSGFVP